MHHHIGESLCVDVELERRLKAVGFRWVSVNHGDDIRLTIYGIKRPLNTVAHKTARRKQAYPVVIEHLCLFRAGQSEGPRQPTRCIAATFALLDLLKQQKRELFEEVSGREDYRHHMESMRRIEEFQTEEYRKMGITEGFETSFSYSRLKAFEIDSGERAEQILRNL